MNRRHLHSPSRLLPSAVLSALALLWTISPGSRTMLAAAALPPGPPPPAVPAAATQAAATATPIALLVAPVPARPPLGREGAAPGAPVPPPSLLTPIVPPPLPAGVASLLAAMPAALPAPARSDGVADAALAVPMPTALHLTPHRSLLLPSAEPVQRVAIADESIAQAIVVSPHQLLVEGRAPGQVSLVVWAGAAPRTYDVDVALDPMPLQRELLRFYPQRLLHVSASGSALTVTGTLANAAQAQQVLNIAAGYAPKIINDLSVDPAPDPAQVLLQVRFAEVDRNAVTQLGANLLSTGRGLVGSLTTGQFGPPNSVTAPPPTQPLTGSVTGAAATFGLSDLLNVFLFNRSANLGLLLKALQEQNLLQILAEPNLLAMDGKEASFLAGGEFPFPVVQGQGVVNNVTIEFKPFGINLHFKPTVLADGTIDLQVAPEVSALDFTNALTISGFLIPALSTRRASTELELRDGQSFVIAGLLDNRLTNSLSKLPGLSSIPVLGKLFESRSTNKSRSELMVVVTAHLVQPSETAPVLPTMPQPFLPASRSEGSRAGDGGGK